MTSLVPQRRLAGFAGFAQQTRPEGPTGERKHRRLLVIAAVRRALLSAAGPLVRTEVAHWQTAEGRLGSKGLVGRFRAERERQGVRETE